MIERTSTWRRAFPQEVATKMAAAQKYYVEYPCAAAILATTSSGILQVRLVFILFYSIFMYLLSYSRYFEKPYKGLEFRIS